MGYQAILFCPDEKLAKVVSQVFNDLDFSLDPVQEPFGAVKKLMAQRFDAVIVDCENEQNASLLFKSARNSSVNQSSLAIALVEGQAGVAKAYRIGANLVLTKPINVEQAKGTLRVARGLLRKNSDTAAGGAKPAAEPQAKPAATPSAPIATSRAATTPVVASPVSAHEVPEFEAPVAAVIDPVPLPAMAASTQAEEIASVVPTPVAQVASVSAQEIEPVQPPAPVAPPKSPLDDIIKNDSLHTIAAPATSPAAAPLSSVSTSAAGSAAAAAPAKQAPVSPTKDAKATGASDLFDTPASTPVVTVAASETSVAGATPSFAAFGDGAEESGGKKKILIVVVALLALAVAGYFGYTYFSKPASMAPAAQPSAAPQNAAPQNTGEPAPKLAPMSVPTMSPSTPGTSRAAADTAGATPKLAIATPSKPASGNPPTIQTESAPEPEAKKPAPAPIVVKSGGGSAKTQTDETAPALAGAAPSNETALNGIMSSAASSVAHPALATLRVSQGVSQGMVIKRVQPKYPQSALSTHAHGAVQIEATIDKEGNVSNVKVLSGDPILARAAVDAVRQWRYKPYYLDGQPVEIQTQITVNFKAD